jgi:putative hydrolase of the HAD superfamily
LLLAKILKLRHNRGMSIKAVLFDLDDTLVEEVASAEAAFLATCEIAFQEYGIEPQALHRAVRRESRELWHRSPARAYCLTVGISSWEGLWARFDGDDPNLETLRAWSPTYRRESWRRALAAYGVDDRAFVDRLAATFPRERRALHTVYPDVEPVLQDLGKSFRLALLTNGAPDLQREKLGGSKLAPYFYAVIVAGEVGVGKPDPRVFALTLERLSVCPEEAVMVGNSLRSDIAGAQRAGLKAIWVNRSGQAPSDEVVPDAQIANLDELGDILSGLTDSLGHLADPRQET